MVGETVGTWVNEGAGAVVEISENSGDGVPITTLMDDVGVTIASDKDAACLIIETAWHDKLNNIRNIINEVCLNDIG